jgi:uncharacterized protein YdeI (YjbR/CyaY-like superfamily)
MPGKNGSGSKTADAEAARLPPDVDAYLARGCGRCALGGTPQCKVHAWAEALVALREIVRGCGLTETVKWGVPCYTAQGRNIAMVAAFKDSCVLSFFKGALLPDPHGLLEKPGENTQAGRVIRFTSAAAVAKRQPALAAYVREAVALELAGAKVPRAAEPGPVPEEFQQRMDADPALAAAFHALTPGRQRGYLLFFAAPKQSKTREARIDKCTPNILAGIGLHDR